MDELRTLFITKNKSNSGVNPLKIEVHPYETKINQILQRIEQRVSETNLQLIRKYDRQLVNESLAHATRLKNLETVLNLTTILNKDWNQVDADDIKELVYNIVTQYSNNGQETHTTYDHKKILKIFFRWVKLGSRSKSEVGDPDETKSVKMKSVKNKLAREQLLTDEDLTKMLNNTLNLRDKAMIAIHYESGIRPGELLSLRLKHISIDEYGAMISVDGKTGARKVRIVNSVPALMNWIKIHPFADDPNRPLWVVLNKCANYGLGLDSSTWKKQLTDISIRAGIKKRVYPNLFRHTSATNSANFLTESQLRKRQGWTADSKMPSVYVHLVNADVDEAYLSHLGIKMDKKPKTNHLPKLCPVCKSPNSYESQICSECGKALDLNSAINLEENKQNEMSQLIKQAVAQEMQRENHYLRKRIEELESMR